MLEQGNIILKTYGRENTFTVFIERNPYRWILTVQPMLIKGEQYSESNAPGLPGRAYLL